MNNQPAHILIVDDDVVNNLITSQRLKEINITTIGIAKNGKEAIDYLDQCNGYYPDLVLLDLNMPVMNGFEVLEYYSHSDHMGKTRFAIVSSSNECEDRNKTSQYEDVIDYILKPLTRDIIKHLMSTLTKQDST